MTLDPQKLLDRIQLGEDSLQRSQNGSIHFDRELLPNASSDLLRATLWRRYTSKKSREQKTTLLHKLGMARPDGQGEWRPTVAGVLMASPHPERHLSSAWIQAVAYRGDTAVPDASGLYQLDAADLTGPLDRQVADACRFVARNMKVRASKRIGRVDLPQYDMTAVFEALVSAGRTDHPAAQQADSRQPAGLRIDRRQRTQADHAAGLKSGRGELRRQYPPVDNAHMLGATGSTSSPLCSATTETDDVFISDPRKSPVAFSYQD